eukprot:2533163-Prymnesium_polylepis.1
MPRPQMPPAAQPCAPRRRSLTRCSEHVGNGDEGRSGRVRAPRKTCAPTSLSGHKRASSVALSAT